MTDRELLELAAKAAGIDVWFPRMSDGNGGVLEPCHRKDTDGSTVEWNPLTDDGDSLRLAVKLGLDLSIFKTWAKAKPDGGKWIRVIEMPAGSVEAATRRAIVLAAAEIGRAMQ